jgi:hypothetical protein
MEGGIGERGRFAPQRWDGRRGGMQEGVGGDLGGD